MFYNYADEKQFQSDFSELNIKGIYLRKAILKRNSEFGIEFHIISSVSEDMSTTAHFIPIQEEHSNVGNPSDSVHYPLQEEHSNQSDKNPYKKVLCSLLLLKKISERDCEVCQFIYGTWTNLNELEKKFVFFLLCREDEFIEKQQQSGLWKQISNNMHQWLELLPQDKRNLFSESRQCGVYTHFQQKEYTSFQTM